MSSSRSSLGNTREGTRVVLREITASLHNNTSPSVPVRRKSSELSQSKSTEHEIKVHFNREFIEVDQQYDPNNVSDNLSSANSFHDLNASTSNKSNTDKCATITKPNEFEDSLNRSYANPSVPGLDDLISACSGIKINDNSAYENSLELSQDQTFTSADEYTPNVTSEIVSSEEKYVDDQLNATKCIDNTIQLACNITQELIIADNSVNRQNSLENITKFQTCDSLKEEDQHDDVNGSSSNQSQSLNQTCSNDITKFETCNLIENTNSFDNPCDLSKKDPTGNLERFETCIDTVETNSSQSKVSNENIPKIDVTFSEAKVENLFDAPKNHPLLFTKSNSSLNTEQTANITNNINELPLNLSARPPSPATDIISGNNIVHQEIANNSVVAGPIIETESHVIEHETPFDQTKIIDDCVQDKPILNTTVEVLKTFEPSQVVDRAENNEYAHRQILDATISIEKSPLDQAESGELEERKDCQNNLDDTLTLDNVGFGVDTEPDDFEKFQPQRQSTGLTCTADNYNIEDIKLEAQKVANNLFSDSLNNVEENTCIDVNSEIFEDPTAFDFLLSHTTKNPARNLRLDSLYVKFDPLLPDTNMLPQSNNQTLVEEEQNVKSKQTAIVQIPNENTPKRNPAIAAIDRLLYFSPMTQDVDKKTEETPEKNESSKETKVEKTLEINVNMAKELELVRATVLQLEEELEKQKTTHVEKVNKLQTQLSQEVKEKEQMTVVMDEYEKSISRLLADRERDRTSSEQKINELQEELQTANQHLNNTEAAFNDVHQKYERLKGIVSAYKSNETVLKESIQDNTETIKRLENRYEQLKTHAMTQLQKANSELDAMRKQHEAEKVKLHALVRKAELKSNSLTELVEQKTKENKELTQILDEVIARVGRQNAE